MPTCKDRIKFCEEKNNENDGYEPFAFYLDGYLENTATRISLNRLH